MARISFSPIGIRRLSEIVEHRIKESILTGEIEPGQRLPPERELARQFGVSVVTAREALRALEVVGYIQRKKGKGGGILVNELQSDPAKTALYEFLRSKRFTLKDICELRRIVEPAAASLAACRMTSELAEDLERNIKYCERRIRKAEQTFSEKEFMDIRRKNVEFHRLVAEATHNPVVALTVEYAVDFLFEFTRNLAPDIQHSIQQTREHRKIFTELRDGRAEEAEKEMLLHLEKAEAYFVARASLT
jgi:GntR family transcriptional repressor for pyruvate dehydrogenase complex